MTSQQYVYKIKGVVKITDGDSCWLELNAGFRMTVLVNIRLDGYDCPERHKGSAYEKAQALTAAQASAMFLLNPDGQLWVQTKPDPDDFGRWLGDIWAEAANGHQLHLGEHLRALNLASVWPRRWREEFDRPTDGTT